MKGIFQVFLGVFAAVLSSAVVLGSLALSLLETGSPANYQQNPELPNTEVSSTDLIRVVTISADQISQTQDQAVQAGQAVAGAGFECPIQAGWMAIAVERAVSIDRIAEQFGLPSNELAQANCLGSTRLAAGQIIYVPGFDGLTATAPAPEATAHTKQKAKKPSNTTAVCGSPGGWTIYIVMRGDTLSAIARATNTTVGQLQFANCMGNANGIRAGQRLYVPFVPRPVFTATPRQPTITQPPSATVVIPPTNPPPTQTPVPPPAPTDVPPPTQPPPTATPVTPPKPTPSPGLPN